MNQYMGFEKLPFIELGHWQWLLRLPLVRFWHKLCLLWLLLLEVDTCRGCYGYLLSNLYMGVVCYSYLLSDLHTGFPVVFSLDSVTVIAHVIVDDKLYDKRLLENGSIQNLDDRNKKNKTN